MFIIFGVVSDIERMALVSDIIAQSTALSSTTGIASAAARSTPSTAIAGGVAAQASPALKLSAPISMDAFEAGGTQLSASLTRLKNSPVTLTEQNGIAAPLPQDMAGEGAGCSCRG